MAFFAGGRRPGRGRIRVLGGGPGCLIMSLVLSIALTVLVNVAVRLF